MTDSVASCARGIQGVISAGALPDAPDAARFTELWRVAGADEYAYLSTPLPVAVSADGRAAIADFDLGEVFIIEPDGAWRGRIARRGMGPGELTSPVAAVWDDEGMLHVYDIVKPAIVRFGRDLAFVGEDRVNPEVGGPIVASGSLEWAGVQPSGAVALLPGVNTDRTTGVASEVLVRVDPSTGSADTLRYGTVPTVDAGVYADIRAPGHDRIAASVGADGLLAVIGGDQGWLLDVYDDDDGVPALRMCAESPEQALTDAERGRSAPAEQGEIAAAFADAAPPDHPARYGRVVIGADRTFWVQRERRPAYPDRTNLYGDAGTTFDVFSLDGQRLRTLRLPPAARLQGALGDTIWAYGVSDLDEVFLVAYQITME